MIVVITIINYDCKTFMVEVTGVRNKKNFISVFDRMSVLARRVENLLNPGAIKAWASLAACDKRSSILIIEIILHFLIIFQRLRKVKAITFYCRHSYPCLVSYFPKIA